MEEANDQTSFRNRQRRDLYRPPILPSPPSLPRVPRLYREPKNKGYIGPVADPPPGFVIGTTSRTEWMVYRALASIFGTPEEPRNPPFIGGPPYWTYQQPYDQGRRAPGGSVIDFVVYAGQRNDLDIAFRIQTEYFHLYADSEVQAHDALQFERLSSAMQVVDLYDFDFAWDDTNEATCILIKDALNGRVSPNPINAGTSMRVTRARYVST